MYRRLKIRYLRLQSSYYRLKAQMMKGMESKEPETVSKKRYYELLAKYRRLQRKWLESKLSSN